MAVPRIPARSGGTNNGRLITMTGFWFTVDYIYNNSKKRSQCQGFFALPYRFHITHNNHTPGNAVNPPSTGMTAPEIKLAISETNHNAALAISSGSP